ncbi:cholesteryl ester transfer protein [Gastrophryne carolinensis]
MSVCLLSISSACDLEHLSSWETGIVCRVTKPAALVLNEKTADVIRAAFRHATFPNITGEKAVRFLGGVTYGLTNIEISNLSIEDSEVDLKEDEAVEIMIKNVSVTFKGTLNYGYGSWFMSVQQEVDLEIYSSIDLQVNTKLTCGKNRVAADTTDCYLSFHKLVLHLHGNKQPGWFKQLFTDFISFTLKLVLKSQICKEINNVADILADFIQDKAQDFLSFEDIGVNIDITSFPIIKNNYMESHHKGLLEYKNTNVYYNSSMYSPSLLTDDRMLYFWFSEQVLDNLVFGYHLDGRLVLTLTGAELQDILRDDKTESHQEIIKEILQDLPMQSPVVKVWSRASPKIKVTTKGTIVNTFVAVQVEASPTANLYFEADLLMACSGISEWKLFFSIKNMLLRGAFMASIDLKDAYWQIPMIPLAQSFMRFAIKGISETGWDRDSYLFGQPASFCPIKGQVVGKSKLHPESVIPPRLGCESQQINLGTLSSNNLLGVRDQFGPSGPDSASSEDSGSAGSGVSSLHWTGTFYKASDEDTGTFDLNVPGCDMGTASLQIPSDAYSKELGRNPKRIGTSFTNFRGSEAKVLSMLSSPNKNLDIKLLTWKVLFLVAITSACRISDIQALSCRHPFLQVFPDCIVIKVDPCYLFASDFHRTREIIIPSINQEDSELMALDVRFHLLQYLQQTKDFRKADSLFISFSGPRKGLRISKTMLARWMKNTIKMAYQDVNMPSGVTAHFTRSETVTTIHVSYADKELILHPSDSTTHITDVRKAFLVSQDEDSLRLFLQMTVNNFGIPAVVKRLGPALTSLMNTKGLNLFEIINPEVISHEGYLIAQMDFGFPHHLLVDFLKKTLQ